MLGQLKSQKVYFTSGPSDVLCGMLSSLKPVQKIVSNAGTSDHI